MVEWMVMRPLDVPRLEKMHLSNIDIRRAANLHLRPGRSIIDFKTKKIYGVTIGNWLGLRDFEADDEDALSARDATALRSA